jgi:hypothetical protein
MMDTRSIAAILLKTAGLILITLSVARLPGLFPVVAQSGGLSYAQILIAAAFGIGPQLILGAVFWLFPGTIANRIVSASASDGAPLQFREFQLIAITVLGLYLLAHALTEIAYLDTTAVSFYRQNPEMPLTPMFGRVAAVAMEFLVGATFCIGGKGLARLIERMRQ